MAFYNKAEDNLDKIAGPNLYFERIARTKTYQSDVWPTQTSDSFWLDDFGFRGFFFLANKAKFGIRLCSAKRSLPRPVRCIAMLVDISGEAKQDKPLIDSVLYSVDEAGKGADTTLKWKEIKDFACQNERDDLTVKPNEYLIRYQLMWA